MTPITIAMPAHADRQVQQRGDRRAQGRRLGDLARYTDVPPIEVRMAWWKDNPPVHLPELLDMVRNVFSS